MTFGREASEIERKGVEVGETAYITVFLLRRSRQHLPLPDFDSVRKQFSDFHRYFEMIVRHETRSEIVEKGDLNERSFCRCGSTVEGPSQIPEIRPETRHRSLMACFPFERHHGRAEGVRGS